MNWLPNRSTPPASGLEGHLLRLVPALATLRHYERAWLAKDLFAGLALTAVMIPAGMGYAEAAHLPAITGLYASIAALVAYAAFGPSRILVLGPDSALAALIASIVLPLAGAHPERAAMLAGMLAILSGALCIGVGLFRLGFVTDLLSKPIRQGYVNGVALTVLIGQAPKLLGFQVSGDNLLQEASGLFRGLMHGDVNPVALGIGAACLLLILGCKRWLPRVPGILVAVAGATVAVALLDLDRRAGVPVIGSLPQGLPVPRIPAVSLVDLCALLPGAVAVALISLADISVLSRIFAARGQYAVNRNQELIALGAANLAAGLLQGFPVTSSSSRTPVAEAAGARTQLTSVIAALSVAMLLLFAPALFRTLPNAALGAVVVAACLGLFEIRSVARLLRLRPSEFAQSMACFAGVALLGVIQGIFIAVALALLAFIWRAWRPYDAVLGRVDGLKGYHDIVRHPEARCIPGLVLFRWDAPLFFANAEIFRDHVLRAVSQASTPTRWVVIAAEPITDVDVTAAQTLAELDKALSECGIELCFAEIKDPVKDRLKRYGLVPALGADHLFPTIGVAVDEYLAQYKVEWRDWEDEAAAIRRSD
ncbi:SulP family inorganic anion transporter [Cupriavidus sp. CV2]|uniref:SulP family inorganic anion transporter n=1 Tax=Cupriavidus ulmosensis TaxID=3065913 RepID=UPI00296AA25C|nr:SulP family inorganic anion transporter [Cupriavidus sp. CV2]MDW3686304.1 SulP family inorganic anion transporter [Cupriavidus sp. CV2]